MNVNFYSTVVLQVGIVHFNCYSKEGLSLVLGLCLMFLNRLTMTQRGSQIFFWLGCSFNSTISIIFVQYMIESRLFFSFLLWILFLFFCGIIVSPETSQLKHQSVKCPPVNLLTGGPTMISGQAGRQSYCDKSGCDWQLLGLYWSPHAELWSCHSSETDY